MSDILRMSVTRDKLYEEVWAEPMTKVAARYPCPRTTWPECATTSTSRFRIAATGRSGSSGRRQPVHRYLPRVRVK